MGRSKNPEGKSKATDTDIVNALNDAIDANEDATAVTAKEVAKPLPIGRQATGKRLDRLAQLDKGVKRFKQSHTWLYYLEQ